MKYIKRTNNNNLYLKIIFLKNTHFTPPPCSIIYIMMKNNIILKKIILPVVLLIFTQQELYGMQNDEKYEQLANNNENSGGNLKKNIWETVNEWVNGATKNDRPKLWWLWAIVDNIPFQYGGSKIWKHGEAYYGLSNGIGFFPSFLNFGWLKIGIGDTHINVINTIIKFMKTYTAIAYNYYYKLRDKNNNNHHKNPLWLNILKWWLFYTVVTDIHLFSFKFFNCVKIKIISIGAVVTSKINEDLLDDGDHNWYFYFDFSQEQLKVPEVYFIFSPRIEINISGIIDLF